MTGAAGRNSMAVHKLRSFITFALPRPVLRPRLCYVLQLLAGAVLRVTALAGAVLRGYGPLNSLKGTLK